MADSSFNPADFGGTTPTQTAQGSNPSGFNPADFGGTAPQASQQSQGSIADQIWGSLVGVGKQIGSQFNQGINQTADAMNEISNPSQSSESPLESGLSAEGGVATAVSAPLAPIMQPIGKAVGGVEDAMSNVPAIQKIAGAIPSSVNLGQLAKDTGNVSNIAGTIAGVDQVAKAVPKAVDAASSLPGKISDAMTTTPEEQAAQDAADAASKQAQSDAHAKAVASDWESPSKINSPAYKNARAVLAKSPEVPTTLAQSGINPFSSIEDGKYNTADVAEQLRDTADKMSSDVVRPALQKADAEGAEPTPATDLTDAAQLQAKSLPGVTAGDQLKIQASIQSEIDALNAKYPDGMSLENMHDEKINYSKNSGYNQFKSNADTNAALANKAISLTLKDAVDSSVPSDAPIQETNAYLTKMYSAADYLDSLNGKKAPVSAAQSVMRFGMKFGGAALAAHLGPMGDLVSPFAGYQIGKAAEGALENMTNAGRAEFLQNMAQTNPEAVTKLQAYISK